MLFTPLPVFFSQNLHVSESLVFGVFMLNSSGSLFGYFFSAKLSQPNDRAVVKKTTLARILFTFIAFGAVWFAFFPLEFSVLALLVLGITYGFFLISILSLSMELIPEGKAGVFNVLTGLGGATGCLWGSFFAENFGFPILLLITAIGFSLSYVIFRTLQKGDDSF
jgi:MFS family permease